MYLGLMIWPMLALAWMFNIVERGSAAYGRIRMMLEEAPAVDDGTEAVPAGRGVLQVAIRDFIYPQASKPSLEQVNFTLQPGQMLGICGPTGAGKSTILALLQRHLTSLTARSAFTICRCRFCSSTAGAPVGGGQSDAIFILRYRRQ